MAMARATMLLYAASVACCLLMGSASAHKKPAYTRIVPIIHIVGGRFGWELPVNQTFYQDWTKNRIFGVGDSLEFPYRTAGTLVQVDKESYDACRMNNALHMFFKGPSRFTLRAPGDYYFISSLGRHCQMGQKLHVLAEAGKQGTGGVRFSYRYRGGRGGRHHRRSLLDVAAAPVSVYPLAPSKAPANAPAPAADTSAATSIMKNVGIASGVIAILSSLFM